MKLTYRLLATVLTAGALLVSGCKSVPSDSTLYATSYAIGAAAGLVADQTKIDAGTRTTVLDVLDIVSMIVPATNETFEVAWTPIATAHVNKLITDGKITAEQGTLILGAFGVAVRGIDYVFVRYPKARQYEELVCAAVDGFTDGFTTVFRPVNSTEAEAETDTARAYVSAADPASAPVAFDPAAYAWLKSTLH